MRIIRHGVNEDFHDFDELDADASEAVDDYEQGLISYEQLAAHVGPEAAREMRRRVHGEESDAATLFDDPEVLDDGWA